MLILESVSGQVALLDIRHSLDLRMRISEDQTTQIPNVLTQRGMKSIPVCNPEDVVSRPSYNTLNLALDAKTGHRSPLALGEEALHEQVELEPLQPQGIAFFV